MKTKILTLGIILLSLTFISSFYAGETIIEEHNLGTDQLIYTIIENTSELTILPEVSFNSTHLQIYFPANMPPNSFTIVFLEESTKEIIKEVQVSSGGGGSGGSSCNYYLSDNLYKKSYLISLRKNCNINFELEEKHSLEFRGIDLLNQIILIDKKTNEEYLINGKGVLCLEREVDGLEILVKSQSNSRVQLDLSLKENNCILVGGGVIQNEAEVGQGDTIDTSDKEIPNEKEKSLRKGLILFILGILFIILGLILRFRKKDGKNN
jgi:hypothetical protein